MTEDPIAAAARAAAERLADRHGPGLAADVEAALHARGTGRSPDRYLDPVELGNFIVSVASLAWSVYATLRQRTPRPPPEVVARQVRVELGRRGDEDPDQITDVVVTEIVRAAGGGT
jgi:hypothetical protein